MYNPKFYETYQNTVVPENTNFNPYADQYFGKNDTTPYLQGVNSNALSPNMLENKPYPLQSSTTTPYLNNVATYARGGKVRKKHRSYRELAERLRQQGQRQDQVLAHINPQEAQMLQETYGGDINPVTGLPQFGLFDNPGKWLKGSLGGGLGAVLGNMILPGVGGIVGGALGGMAGSAARGRKDFANAGLRGAGMGAILPTAAGIGSSILGGIGQPEGAKFLEDYGTKNAILPSLGLGENSIAGNSSTLTPGTVLKDVASSSSTKPVSDVVAREAANNVANTVYNSGTSATTTNDGSFWDKLIGNTKDYLTEPANLLTTAAVAASALNRPKKEKEKSPEQIADETKRLERALRNMSPEERAEKEAQLLAEAQMKRRIERNKFLPEEKLGDIEPLYIRTNTPEEYAAQGKWLNYYNNPEFSGAPIPYRKGGHVISELMGRGHAVTPHGILEEFIEFYPSGLIKGTGGGQDDDIRAILPKDSYIVEGSTTSDLGDGNTEAGANKILERISKEKQEKRKPTDKAPVNKIHALISAGETYISPEDVKRLGKGDVNKGVKILDTLQKNVRKHKRGGKITLPPKARPINSYIRGVK